MDPFTKQVSPLTWCKDVEALLALKPLTDETGKRVLTERHPGAKYLDEYFLRIRAATQYLLKHKAAWKNGGLMTEDEVLKRSVIFVLYGHFAAADLEGALSAQMPTDAFVYGASRVAKDFLPPDDPKSGQG